MRTIIAAAYVFSCAAPILLATDLKPELARIAQDAHGRVGISAVLVESGEHVALNGDQPFFMASVVKFPVALHVLHLVDTGKLRLDEKVRARQSDRSPGVSALGGHFKAGAVFSVRQLLEYMMMASDNTACDILMRISGGPQAVMARLQALGIQGMRVDRMERQVAADYRRSRKLFLKDPRDRSTPDAAAALLAKFQQGETLKPDTTALLRDLMERATTFPNRLKGLLPPGTVVAHKTGTWGEAAVNDVGIITLPGGSRHIAIAVFTSGSKDQDNVEQVIAELADAAYKYWEQ